MPAPMPPTGRRDERKRPQGGPSDQKPGGRSRWTMWYFLLGLLLVLLIMWAADSRGREDISYGRFRSLLTDGRVSEVVVTSGEVKGKYRPEGGDSPQPFEATRLPNDDKLPELLQEHAGDDWRYETSLLESPLLLWILPIVLLIIVWRLVLGRMNPVSSVMDFSQSRANAIAQEDVGVTFDDVAGIEECKQELQEVVEFLRTPSKFTRLGGRIPTGVLLVGPPGTGKTLLAKAVAGEAEVTFYSLSGSDFVEMFVGVGAARVRDLFEQAEKNAPCIIFIDELDALGKARGMGMMGGHDEREQTLNALLVRMDGFQTQKGVILLAATNRPEMLDPALLRPGRFDRQVMVPAPDLKDREAILRVHTREVKLADSVDLRKLAGMTPGFVGADLANLVNEATLLAARRGKDQVHMEDFEDSIERVVAGLEKRNRLMNDEEKNIVAHHEVGHALVACLVPGADPVRKVSMIPRGAAALGYTMQMPTEDRYVLRRNELMDRMAVMLGGRSAEEVVFGEISTGAQNDLQKATELAREMVIEFGMCEELGPLSYSRRGNSQGGPSEFFGGSRWSERTAR
ncbi:MAG: ATP-dependent zinc metalloprotease FtsH, partial [Candidatus Brocadiia bacterium]